MNINGTGGPSAAYGTSASADAGKASATDFAALFKALKAEASKTPEQRARERVLEKHELTEESYQRLPEDQRAAIDAEIREAAKRVAEQRRAGMQAERTA